MHCPSANSLMLVHMSKKVVVPPDLDLSHLLCKVKICLKYAGLMYRADREEEDRDDGDDGEDK